MIWRLDIDNPYLFPDPYTGEENGLLAVGGDLSFERLLSAYSMGIFPWYGFKESPEIMWWCPLNRFVIFPKNIHISHSMHQIIKSEKFHVTTNKAFNQVIENCGKANNRHTQPGAWLGEDIMKAYTELHNKGYAMSVEVWKDWIDDDNIDKATLVGGLYGVTIRNIFIGESMFSLVPNASKLALIKLASIVEELDGFIDCQLETQHLKSMGGTYISYEEYMHRLHPYHSV